MMKKARFEWVIVLLLFMQTSIRAGKDTFWLGIAGGQSTVDIGGTLFFNASYQSQCHCFSVRTLGTGAWLDKGKNMSECSVLYHRATQPSSFYLSAGAGLGFVHGWIDERGIFGTKEDTELGKKLGVPLEIQFIWRPLPIVGVGVTGFANINSVESYAGWLLTLQVGKLK